MAISDPSATAEKAATQRLIRLHGFPIAYSASPLFQNTCFAADSYPCRYELYSTSEVTEEVMAWLRSDQCAGAAGFSNYAGRFTMPLKASIIPHLDDITPESRLTGAVNTVVKVEGLGEDRLVGTNTDFLGILSTLQRAIHKQKHSAETNRTIPELCVGQYSALVVGGGATTRSAILALWTLGIRHICLINRDAREVESTIEWFKQVRLAAKGLVLRHVCAFEDAEALYGEDRDSDWPQLALGVGAIPSILPSTADERRVYSTAAHLLSHASVTTLSNRLSSRPSDDGSASLNLDSHTIARPIFLDMAYIPRQTHLLKLADALGWETISGEKAMIEQGFAQQRMWRSADASAETGMKAGVLSEKAMGMAIDAVRTAGPIQLLQPEVDLANGSSPGGAKASAR